jgi:hypothetical protein
MATGMKRWVGQLRQRDRDESAAAAPLGEAVKGLRQLVAQGQSLPTAAASLDASARQLATLGDTVGASLDRVASEVAAALRDGILEIRADMKTAVEESGAITRQALEPALERGIERSVASAAERTDALAETLRAHVAAQGEAETAWLARLETHSAELAERIATRQAAFAEQLAAGVQARTEQLLDRLEAAATALGDAGREQQNALALALESAEARVATLESETGRRLHALFDALQQGAERQAETLAGFEERLGEQRAAEARALQDALVGQGSALAAQLATAAEQVREAATLVHAGGAELSALAEAFGQAVERHRDASVAWLERLGDVEGAVDRAGRERAAEALGAQLAATEEVLARQLDFQRELFEQLRALRAGEGGAAPTRPAADDDGAVSGDAEDAPADV